ncbi:MAG: hypothetical protein K0Q55_939 [Verrucomicrobia bacterium]|nr:hypothetical protein [Verrucomicrobiota bacterium]
MRYMRYVETKFILSHASTLPYPRSPRYPSARYNTYNYTKFIFPLLIVPFLHSWEAELRLLHSSFSSHVRILPASPISR